MRILVSGLVNNTQYAFVVTSLAAGEESVASAVVTATPFLPASFRSW